MSSVSQRERLIFEKENATEKDTILRCIDCGWKGSWRETKVLVGKKSISEPRCPNCGSPHLEKEKLIIIIEKDAIEYIINRLKEIDESIDESKDERLTKAYEALCVAHAYSKKV